MADGKKKRRAVDGPMFCQKKAFIQKMREDVGLTYQQAVKAWMASAERQSIVMSVARPEPKRHRGPVQVLPVLFNASQCIKEPQITVTEGLSAS